MQIIIKNSRLVGHKMSISKLKLSLQRSILCFLAVILFSFNGFSGTRDSIAKRKIYHVNHYVAGSIIAVGMGLDVFQQSPAYYIKRLLHLMKLLGQYSGQI